MPNQCTKCGATYPDASEELLKGCTCGSRFFYYIRQDKYDELNQLNSQEIINTINELALANKEQIEQDIREITGIEEDDEPVILDLESVRVIEPGKFEIDIVNLFTKKRPLIYQIEEGKYIIDLNASIKAKKEDIYRKIRDPKPIIEEQKKAEEAKKKIEEEMKKYAHEKEEKEKNKIEEK